eukprot:8064042-Lingulodinium_polyedra.AAC.1
MLTPRSWKGAPASGAANGSKPEDLTSGQRPRIRCGSTPPPRRRRGTAGRGSGTCMGGSRGWL